MDFKAVAFITALVIATGISASHGQIVNVQGVVRSKTDGEKIPYAYLFLNDSSAGLTYGAMSDLEGRFRIVLPEKYANGYLNISCVGMKPAKLALGLVKNREDCTVELQESVTALPEVAVSDGSAKALIKRCIEAIEVNYLSSTLQYLCFSWQSKQVDSAYQYLKENYLTVIENNRTIGVDRIVKGDSMLNNDGNTAEVLDRYSSPLYFDFVRSKANFINAGNLSEWTFSYDTSINYSDEYAVVLAQNTGGITTLKLKINLNDDAFEEIDYQYHWQGRGIHNFNESQTYSMDRISGKVIYKKIGSTYGLKYVYSNCSYHAFKKYTAKNIFRNDIPAKSAISLHSEFIVLLSSKHNAGNKSAAELRLSGHSALSEVVNKKAYCEAAVALAKNIESGVCSEVLGRKE